MRGWISIFFFTALMQANVAFLEIEVGEVTWGRNGIAEQPLVYQTTSSGTASLMNVSDVNRSNDWTPGFLARLGIFPVSQFGLDLRYLGLLKWTESRAVSTLDTNVTYSLNVLDGFPISFTRGTQAIEEYQMGYESADMLFAWNFSPLYEKFFGMRVEAGPSFIYVYDRLSQVLTSPVFLQEYNIRSDNYLLGGRMYAELIGVPKPFIWGVRGSAGIYSNIYYQSSYLDQSIPTIKTFSYPTSSSWMSTLIQGEIFFGITFLNAWRLKASYGGELLSNIGSATNQLGLAFGKESIQTRTKYLLSGVAVSLEVDLF